MATCLYLGVVTYQQTLTLTDAQVKTLGTNVTHTMVNGSPGFIVMPQLFSVGRNFASGAYGNNTGLQLLYKWGASGESSSIMADSDFADGSNKITVLDAGDFSISGTALSSLSGLSFTVVSTGGSGALTGGHASNSLAITLNYVMIPIA